MKHGLPRFYAYCVFAALGLSSSAIPAAPCKGATASPHRRIRTSSTRSPGSNDYKLLIALIHSLQVFELNFALRKDRQVARQLVTL